MALHPKKFTELSGLHFDKAANTYWGTLEGYPVFLTFVPRRDTVIFRLIGKTPADEISPDLQAQANAWCTSHAGVTGLAHRDRCLSAAVSLTPRNTDENLSALTAALVTFAATQGLIPCCMSCGAEYDYRSYLLDDGGVTVCDSCQPYVEQKLLEAQQDAAEVKANPAGLAAGALIGAAVVFFLTFFVLKLSYLSMLTGYAGVLLGLFLMRKLGRKLTTPAVIIFTVLCLAAGFAAPVAHFANLIAETNTENYDKAKQASDGYTELMALYDGLSEDQLAELDVMGEGTFDLDKYKEIYDNAQLIMNHTTTASCLKDMPKLLNNTYYSDAKPELIKCLLFAVLSVLAGAALTAPAMLKADQGKHTLRELPA